MVKIGGILVNVVFECPLGLLMHRPLPSPFELEPPYRRGSPWAEDPQDLPLTSILESFILNSRKLMKSQKYIFSLDDYDCKTLLHQQTVVKMVKMSKASV